MICNVFMVALYLGFAEVRYDHIKQRIDASMKSKLVKMASDKPMLLKREIRILGPCSFSRFLALHSYVSTSKGHRSNPQ